MLCDEPLKEALRNYPSGKGQASYRDTSDDCQNSCEIEWHCSGLMPPDISLGENDRHDEVSDEATSYIFSRVQSQRCIPGS